MARALLSSHRLLTVCQRSRIRRSNHYATALGLPGGLLVYAQGEADTASYTVRRCGTRLEVAALELAGTLEEILEAVRHIAKKIVRLRDEAGGTRMGNRLFVTDPRRHFG